MRGPGSSDSGPLLFLGWQVCHDATVFAAKCLILLKGNEKVGYCTPAGQHTLHTTGTRGSEAVVQERVLGHRIGRARLSDATRQSLRARSEPFYTAGQGPRVLRKREEGQAPGAEYVHR
jgi:hypothetical protein